MSTHDPHDCGDVKTTALRAVMAPVGRIFKNEVSFLLVVIIVTGCSALVWVAREFKEFVKTQIPAHIEAIKQGNKEITTEFVGALKQKDDRYLELRKIDREQNDLVERLATGRKTTGLAPVSVEKGN